MEPVTVILGGITVAVASGAVTKVFGTKNNVKDKLCSERRTACSLLIVEKIDNLASDISEIKEAINKNVQ